MTALQSVTRPTQNRSSASPYRSSSPAGWLTGSVVRAHGVRLGTGWYGQLGRLDRPGRVATGSWWFVCPPAVATQRQRRPCPTSSPFAAAEMCDIVMVSFVAAVAVVPDGRQAT